MTITIDVPIELERRLEQASRQRGIGKAEFLRNLLEEKLGSGTPNPPFDFPAKIIATDLPVRDRTREYAWVDQHRDEYEGQYVALDGDTLIAAGASAKEVVAVARARGIMGALVLYVDGGQQLRDLGGGLWR